MVCLLQPPPTWRRSAGYTQKPAYENTAGNLCGQNIAMNLQFGFWEAALPYWPQNTTSGFTLSLATAANTTSGYTPKLPTAQKKLTKASKPSDTSYTASTAYTGKLPVNPSAT